MGHVGLAVPVHSAECGMIELPAGQVGFWLISHVQLLISNLAPLGQVGLLFLSQEQRPRLLTISVKPLGQIDFEISSLKHLHFH